MKRWQAMNRWKKIGLGIGVAFIALIVFGAIIQDTKTKTVTKTVMSTVTVTTKSDPIVKAPPSCIAALRLMTGAFALVESAANIYLHQIEPAARAGLAGDAAALNAATANMNRATAKITKATPLVRRATPLALACRASG